MHMYLYLVIMECKKFILVCLKSVSNKIIWIPYLAKQKKFNYHPEIILVCVVGARVLYVFNGLVLDKCITIK